MVKFSVLIPFRNTNQQRERNLWYTLSQYRKHLPDCELIVVEQISATQLGGAVDKQLLLHSHDGLFCKPQCFNEGSRISSGDYLVLGDADCVPELDFFQTLPNQQQNLDKACLLPYQNPVYYLSEAETQRFVVNFSDNCGDNQKRDLEAKKHASGGVVLISAEKFYRIGGFDYRFRGWGAEDDAFCNKCIALGIPIKRSKHQLVHLHHLDTFTGGSNYGENVKIYNTDYGKQDLKPMVRDLGYRHLTPRLDANRIAIVSNTHHPELYRLSLDFYEDLPIRKIAIDGSKGLYSLSFFDHVVKTLTDVDWMICLDEDFFVIDRHAMLDLLYHQIQYRYGFSGVPDGGVVDHRFHNPVSINPFFTIVNLKQIRERYESFKLKSPWGKDLMQWEPKHLLKPDHQLSYDEFEPYYQFFFWALRDGVSPLYLDAQPAPSLDPLTTVIMNHRRKPFGYHTWFARSWTEPEHQARIRRVAEFCQQIRR